MLESTHRLCFLYLVSLMLCFYEKNSVVSLSVPDGDRCRPGWLQYQNHSIKFFKEIKTWSEARETCRTFDGDLVTIYDEKKQMFVYNNLAVGKTLWIGLKRDDNHVFHWVDGTKLQFTNWVGGHPDSLSEKCGEMTDYGVYRGKWNDKFCSSSQPFICESAINFSNVFKIFPGKMLLGHGIKRVAMKSDVECLLRCQRYPGCESTNFVRRPSKGQNVCELIGQTYEILSKNLYSEELSSYYDLVI
ncbi:snaclec agkisacutacin subunit A-like [Oculina patagonica]